MVSIKPSWYDFVKLRIRLELVHILLREKNYLTDYIFSKEKFLLRVGGVLEASKNFFFNCFFVCILLII